MIIFMEAFILKKNTHFKGVILNYVTAQKVPNLSGSKLFFRYIFFLKIKLLKDLKSLKDIAMDFSLLTLTYCKILFVNQNNFTIIT